MHFNRSDLGVIDERRPIDPDYYNNYDYFYKHRPNYQQSKQKQASHQRNEEEEDDSSSDPQVCCTKCCGINSYSEAPASCYSMEFCRTSSLHGLRFVGQKSGHILERLLFGIAFTLGILASAYLIYDIWSAYDKSPIMITFTEKDIPIEQIPFPAITICNINNVRKSYKDQYMLQMKNISSTDQKRKDAREKLFYLQHICEATSKGVTSQLNFTFSGKKVADDLFTFLANNTVKENVRSESNGINTKRVLRKTRIDQPCKEMVIRCLWQNKVTDCSDLFYELATDFGKCCSFNLAPIDILLSKPSDIFDNKNDDTDMWSKDDLNIGSLISAGIKKKGDISARYPDRPRRVRQAGLTNGLSVLLDPDIAEYYCSGTDSVGFTVGSHFSIDLPHMAEFGDSIAPGMEAFVQITPEVVKSDPGIRTLPIEKRKCYFIGEKKLASFNFYSYSNCVDECLANLTRQSCKCVPFYMPQGKNGSLCTHYELNCPEENHNLLLAGLDVDLVKTFCPHCRPSCTSVNYKSDITTRNLRDDVDLWSTYDGPDTTSWKDKKLSLIHFYFAEDSTYPKIRKRLIELTDLFGRFGGLLGLCLGFSVISLVELLYFLLVRILGRNLNDIEPHHFKKMFCFWRNICRNCKTKKSHREDHTYYK